MRQIAKARINADPVAAATNHMRPLYAGGGREECVIGCMFSERGRSFRGDADVSPALTLGAECEYGGEKNAGRGDVEKKTGRGGR